LNHKKTHTKEKATKPQQLGIAQRDFLLHSVDNDQQELGLDKEENEQQEPQIKNEQQGLDKEMETEPHQLTPPRLSTTVGGLAWSSSRSTSIAERQS
jgi:hypothetical protein